MSPRGQSGEDSTSRVTHSGILLHVPMLLASIHFETGVYPPVHELRVITQVLRRTPARLAGCNLRESRLRCNSEALGVFVACEMLLKLVGAVGEGRWRPSQEGQTQILI